MIKPLIVHGVRMKLLTTATNSTVQIGKPDNTPDGRLEVNNLVTSYIIENQGRNSVLRIGPAEGNPYVELRPGDPPFVIGVEWPSVLRHTLTVVFVEENQQQWAADGTRPEVNPESTDPNNPAALIHKGVIVENFVNLQESCLT